MEKRTRPYEVLVRYHAGGAMAAHVCEVEDIIDDDGVTILASKELPTRPLLAAGPDFREVVEKIDAVLLRQLAASEEEKSTLKAALDAADAKLAALAKQLAASEVARITDADTHDNPRTRSGEGRRFRSSGP